MPEHWRAEEGYLPGPLVTPQAGRSPEDSRRERMARLVTAEFFDLIRDDAPRSAIRDASYRAADAVLAADTPESETIAQISYTAVQRKKRYRELEKAIQAVVDYRAYENTTDEWSRGYREALMHVREQIGGGLEKVLRNDEK